MKQIYTVLFATVLSINLMAQDTPADDKQSVRFGLVVNPGLSWLTPSKTGQEGKMASFAFSYGLQLEFRISDYVSLATGIAQANFNGKVSYTDSVNLEYKNVVAGIEQPPTKSLINSRTYVFNSIEVPFKLKLKTPEIGYITYFLEAGIVGNVNYKIYAKKNSVTIGGSSAELNGDLEKIDVNDDTNWFRFGSTLSAGMEYNFVGNTALLVSINWTNAFTNALKSEPSTLSYSKTGLPFKQSAKLDYVGLSVGILF